MFCYIAQTTTKYSIFQLYAETLSWDSDQIGVDPEHPEAVEWKRKEALYNQVLQYFDRGKVNS